jgi:hypothetical protein
MGGHTRGLSAFGTKCKFCRACGGGADPTLFARIAATDPRGNGAVRCAPAQKVPVDAEVQTQYQAAQKQLDISTESGGVQHREDVMLDEITLVRRAACGGSEDILERRERADPAGELDHCTPYRGWDVQVRYPSPSQHQQSTEDHEEHEREVEDDDEVS